MPTAESQGHEMGDRFTRNNTYIGSFCLKCGVGLYDAKKEKCRGRQ
jgi:hypothetical protein